MTFYLENDKTDVLSRKGYADNIFWQLGCDPDNVMPYGDPFGNVISYGPFSLSRNCFGGKSLEGYVFDYVDQFFKTYEKDRKFFSARIIAGHEGTTESGKYVDLELRKLLGNMDSRGEFNNTVVLFFSDHGNHLNRFVIETEPGHSELMNPFLFAMVPDWLDEKFGENLKKNQQKITTHFDIFESLWKLISKEEKHFGSLDGGAYSFFHDIGKDLTCKQKSITGTCRCVNK